MLGTIEDLNNDIEKFQNNIVASNELCDLLKKIADEVTEQSKTFSEKANVLISRLNDVPGNIEHANDKSNAKIKEDVQEELNKEISEFKAEEKKYIDEVAQTQSMLREYITRVEIATTKTEGIPREISEGQLKLNNDQREAIQKIFSSTELHLAEEQKKYINQLAETRDAVGAFRVGLEEKYQNFVENLANTNIARLQEQNIALQNSLNKKSILLAVMVVISIVLSVVGLFV